MQRTFSVFLYLAAIFLCTARAQATNTDSLKSQLKQTSAQQLKMKLLYAIGSGYLISNNPDSALVYFKEADKQATALGDDSMIIEAKLSTGKALHEGGQLDKAIFYCDTVIIIARKLGIMPPLMDALIERSDVKLDLTQLKGLLPDIREALAIAHNYHFRAGEAHIYQLLAVYDGLFDDYATQLDYLNKSTGIYDSLNMYRESGINYYNISIVYAKQKEYKKALQYANYTDSLYKKIGASNERNFLKIHEGILYKNLGDYDKALKLYSDCLDSFRHDDYTQVLVYANMGIVQSLKGDLAGAKRSFFTSLSINKVLKMPDADIHNYRELGRAFLQARQYDSALHYAKYSEQLCTDAKLGPDEAKECVALLRDIYVAQADWANAHIYDIKYEALQDTINNNQQALRLIDAETRLNVFEKDKAISQLATENELRKVKEQGLFITLILGGVIVIIVVVVYRRTLRSNKLLSAQKQQLELQKEELQNQKRVIDDQVVQLGNAAAMKSKFLANISHELRTPVTLLTGMLELSSGRKTNDDKEKERLNIAYNNSRKLQHMVEEILDLTRLENNVSQPVYETKELAPLLRRIIFAFETLIEKEHLHLEYNDANAQGIFISIDVNKFEKVINNLVYNAIKFNKKDGNIKISLSPAVDGGHAEVRISDTGIGIMPADIPHIFEHFYQGDSSGLKAAGAGIGLSLVKEFTELMGGSVTVTSKPGTGSEFILTFPLAIPVPETVSVNEEALVVEWNKLPNHQTVLIVEDNPEMQYYIKEVLGEKVKTVTAGNGYEALEWLGSNMPDLIISDVMMPGMDGRELVTYLKSQEQYKKLPVITLTALADVENQLSFLRLGVDDYIVKPFNAAELQIRVYNLLINSAERNKFKHQPAEAGDIAENSKEADKFRETIKTYVLSRIRDMNISVTDIAYEFSVSERQLQRIAKSLTGYSPAQLVKEVRLQKAYELLVDNNSKIYKVDDIANRVGYETASYFARQFYERFGKRPSDFL